MGYNITEVFDGINMGSFNSSDSFSVYVNPTGIFFGKATPIASSSSSGSMKDADMRDMLNRLTQQ